MTITVEFKGFKDMMDFARNLVKNDGMEDLQPLMGGPDVYRQSESSLQEKQEEPTKDGGQPADVDETTSEPAKTAEERKDEEPKYTLVQVREKLSELQKAGKRAKVQELIAGFGVKKLMEVPEDRYVELMQKAGEL